MSSKTEQRGVGRRTGDVTLIRNSLQSVPLPSKKSNRGQRFRVTQNSHLVFTSKILHESNDDPQHKKDTAAHTPMPVKESKAIYLWTKVKHNLKYLIEMERIKQKHKISDDQFSNLLKCKYLRFSQEQTKEHEALYEYRCFCNNCSNQCSIKPAITFYSLRR